MGQNPFFKISITVFIRLNAAAFINLLIKFRDSSVVIIRGRRLYKGGGYLKSTLFFLQTIVWQLTIWIKKIC